MTKMKLFAALAAALALTAAVLLLAPATTDAAGVCDPQRSLLCRGLVDVWGFEDSTPDYTRFGSFADTPLLEVDGHDVGNGGGKLGTYAVKLGDAAGNGLVAYRSPAFVNGYWTWAAWVYIPSGANTTIPLFSTSPCMGAPCSSNQELDGSVLSLVYSAGFYPKFQAWEQETGTAFSKQGGTALSVDTYHLLVLTMSPIGDYGKSRACFSVDGGAFDCGTLAYSFKGNSYDLQLGYRESVEYRTVYLDGMGIWARTWDATDVYLYYNGSAGRAFPFY